ncbi:MAG TPA: hypothetical protein VHF22_08510, partial [Planctomycetota bacterium]|nr:hypothetical protein [Planctomycetota bacterium]
MPLSRTARLAAAAAFALASLAGTARATTIFYADSGAHAVREYDYTSGGASGTLVRSFVAPGTYNPYDVAFGADGDLYVTNDAGTHATIEVFDPRTGNHLRSLAVGSVLVNGQAEAPLGLAVSPLDGSLWFITNQAEVYSVDPATGTVTHDKRVNGATDLAFTAADALISSGSTGSSVSTREVATGNAYTTGGGPLAGIAFAPDGRLFALGVGGTLMAAPAGGGSMALVATLGGGARYLAFDGAGNIWVAAGTKI